MRMRRLALMLVLVACVPLTVDAGQAPAKDRTVTNGDFAVMLAAKTGRGRDLSEDAAVQALRKAGVPLGHVSAALTEKDLTAILGFYGVKAVTNAPDKGVSLARAESVLIAAGGALSPVSASVSVNQSPADICLTEANHGQCVNCCREFGGTSTDCSKFCHAINKPSPSEPLP